MTLIDKLKQALLEARKARDPSRTGPLTTLIGDIETLAKAGRGETTDAVVVTMLKKYVKNVTETIALNSKHGNHATAGRLHDELKLYESFLPKQLTDAELIALIDSQSSAKDVGDVMRFLKAEYAGTYDGALASKLLKAKFKPT
jgi:hypothetical protein